MKGRRRPMKRTRHHDPVESFLEESLKSGQYAPFYCNDHGQHFLLPGGRPACPVCGELCFTPDEWAYRNSTRKRRERRIQLLRNHLE